MNEAEHITEYLEGSLSADPVTPDSLIRYHLHRPWIDGGRINGLDTERPRGVEDPCGDCGEAKADHPSPYLKSMPRADLARRILAMEDALRYIERPTMGLPGGVNAEHFAVFEATGPNAKAALATCIRMAKAALRA